MKKDHRQGVHKAIVQGKVDLVGLPMVMDLAEHLPDRAAHSGKRKMFFYCAREPLHIVNLYRIYNNM